MGGFISTIVGDVFAGTQAGLVSRQPFRPSQWSQPAMVSITVPAQASSSNTIAASGNPDVNQSQGTLQMNTQAQTTYVFDAVLGLDHEQRLELTRHPVQTGADISSHAYLHPAVLVIYVGMSDAMDSYANAQSAAKAPYYTPFTGNASKSVSAYQQMLALQASRVPLTVTTRLRTYTNMMITHVSPREDHKTIAGLRMRVEFTQIFTAAISDQPVSARPSDTQNTGLGAVDTQPPSASVTNQFNLKNATQDFLDSPIVTYGAGNWSSVNTNSLTQLPPPVGGGS
jgi:hypothetical protein